MENTDYKKKYEELAKDYNSLLKDYDELFRKHFYYFDWFSIRRVAILNNVPEKSISWRKLQKAAEEVGNGIFRPYEPNFGEVKTYNQDTWELAYPHLEL